MADPDRSRPFLQGVEGLVQFGDHPVGHDSVRLQGSVGLSVDAGDHARRVVPVLQHARLFEAGDELRTERGGHGGGDRVGIGVQELSRPIVVDRAKNRRKSLVQQELQELLLEKLMKMNQARSLEDLHKRGILEMSDMFISNNFALREDSIEFYYNEYDIAPYAYGAFSICLSYEEVQKLMPSMQEKQ